MSDTPQRSVFGSIALSLFIAVLVGTNVFFATSWYMTKNTPAPVVTVAAPATPPPSPTPAATPEKDEKAVVKEPIIAPPADLPPLPTEFKIVNGHEHLYRIQDFERYMPAADEMGVAKTLFVASSKYTITGKKERREEGNEENSKEVLACAAKYPDKVIPFVTFTPKAADKIKLLEDYKAAGAKGLKLYTGHNDFHDQPLDDPEMLPVYEWLEKNQFPLVWHVNLNSFQDELTRVLLRFPKLRVMIPHFGVGFFDTKGKILERLGEILDTYPNVFVDSSFGTREILVSGMEKVSMVPGLFRAFYEKYQDRIVFGTDMVVTGNKEKTTAWMSSVIRACREMHEKQEYTFWMARKDSKYADKNANNVEGHLRGLALPPEILKKIYETNVEKFLGNS